MAVITALGFTKNTATPARIVSFVGDDINSDYEYEPPLVWTDVALQGYLGTELNSFMTNPLWNAGGGGGGNNRPTSGLIYPRGVN